MKAVGAHPLNSTRLLPGAQLFYWRQGDLEIDFIILYKKELFALEAKSGDDYFKKSALESFSKDFPLKRALLIGERGIPLHDFFSIPLENWLFPL